MSERKLLQEAADLLRHTECKDGDATRCPACSLESRIETVLKLLPQPREYHFVCDGPPSHESGRFVELENERGQSICPGRWEQRGQLWHLIVPAIDADPALPVWHEEAVTPHAGEQDEMLHATSHNPVGDVDRQREAVAPVSPAPGLAGALIGAAIARRATGPAPSSPAPDGSPRFFIDHGVIHDRITGRHVHGNSDIEPGIADESLLMLNDLHGSALRELQRFCADKASSPAPLASGETPETDALLPMMPVFGSPSLIAWIDAAMDSHRTLERQRNALQRDLEKYRDQDRCDFRSHHEMAGELAEARGALEEARRERDEAEHAACSLCDKAEMRAKLAEAALLSARREVWDEAIRICRECNDGYSNDDYSGGRSAGLKSCATALESARDKARGGKA